MKYMPKRKRSIIITEIDVGVGSFVYGTSVNVLL